MKKGHRRTNSQTIGLNRPFSSRIEKTLEHQQFYFQPKFQPQTINFSNNKFSKFSSIQSLLEKCQQNIAQRVLYIENLQQPNTDKNHSNDFAFGKGVNYKLSNFKLNMGEIPQVTMSNDSTSLQDENKIDILQRELFFTHGPYENSTPNHLNTQKQLTKIIKFHPKHAKTSSTVANKKINKIEKSSITETKHPLKNMKQESQKNIPLKRLNFQYPAPKKIGNQSKEQGEALHGGGKICKQVLLERFGINDQKKKKIISLNQIHKNYRKTNF